MGRPLLLRVAVGAGAGLTLVPAFPPYGVWPLAILVPAVLALAVRGLPPVRAALVGLVAGLGLFVPLLHWTGIDLGPAPWLLLAAFEALYVALLGVGLALVQRLPAWPLWTACLWVAEEALRGRWPFGGFTWGRLAFSQVDAPSLGLAALGGAPLLTFAAALAGGLLAWAALQLRYGALARAVVGGAAAGLVLLAGLAVPMPAPTGPTATVAVVQGNVPRLGLDFAAQRQAVLRNHVDATLDLAARVESGQLPAPDLVLWPENASDIDPYRDPEAAALIDGAVRAVGVPVLVGAVVVTADEQGVENTGILWDPVTGPGETYVKQHPVPFAEYIPFRGLARLVVPDVDELRPRDMVKGDEVGLLPMGPATVGDVICFEIAYDELVRAAVRDGADVVAVQTNNATFGFTAQTEQQLVMSRLRAVEHGRAVLVAATSGVSAVIGSDGTVQDRAEIFTRDLLVEQVDLSDRLTPATRLGALPEAVLTAVGLAALLVALRVRGPARQPVPGETADLPEAGRDSPTPRQREVRM